MISTEEFDTGFHHVWRSVENDFDLGLIDYEADLQASTYYHLRKRFGDNRSDFRILCDVRLDGFRPDIGLEWRNPRRLWIAFEFKKMYDTLTDACKRDVGEKMRRYRSLGAERGYFCFTVWKDCADTITAKLNRSAAWAKGKSWLAIAKGFHDRNGKVTDPWSVRIV